MTRSWQSLADAIKKRRAALGTTQQQLAEDAAVTVTTIRNLEGGRDFKRIPPSVYAVEHALGWERGSALAVLEGGEPALRQRAIIVSAVGTTGPFELRLSDLQGAARSGILHSIPGATAAEVLAAERRMIAILRERGLVPPEDQDPGSESGS